MVSELQDKLLKRRRKEDPTENVALQGIYTCTMLRPARLIKWFDPKKVKLTL